MNKELLDAMNAVISDLEQLSDSDFHEKIEENRGGAIYTATLDWESFLTFQFNCFIEEYTFSSTTEIEAFMKIHINVNSTIFSKFDQPSDAVNDKKYLLAA